MNYKEKKDFLKAERERIKNEKKKEKERLKKIEHKKKLRSKQNKRAYAKIKKQRLKEFKMRGDEYAYFSIYIAKNNKRIGFVGTSWWKSKAYKIFNDAIEKNKKNVLYPQTKISTLDENGKCLDNVKYEILLVKKVKDEEAKTSAFRNKDGKVIEHVIEDWPNHVIIDKHDWMVEETFNVYGFHPYYDRKDYKFILHDIILEDSRYKDNMKRIMVYQNKLIIEHIDDFDFITCRDNEQTKELYDRIESDVSVLNNSYVVFMGELAPGNVSLWLDKFQDKTGWKRNVFSRKDSLQ